jgi:hypothetical protein
MVGDQFIKKFNHLSAARKSTTWNIFIVEIRSYLGMLIIDIGTREAEFLPLESAKICHDLTRGH